jgi:FecR protein
MKGSMGLPVRLLAGMFIAALSAMPQYTISARPGVINTIEGTAYVNGVHVTDSKAAQRMFLNPNDTLSTDTGKAEILLTPGVYLRVGANSEVRMISPSLTDTQVAVVKGEAMIEAMDLLKENSIRVKIGDSQVRLEKIGLYRFTASNPPVVAVFDGKASLEGDGKKVDVGKEHQLVLESQLKPEKFKAKDDHGDLYAWSKTRDEYSAASSYSASKTVASSNSLSGGGWSGYSPSGFGSYGGPGWFYNPIFGSYAWLPGDGAFFSPFGFGYFSPGYVYYAPVVYSSLGGVARGTGVAVPVNPNHMPVVATTTGSRPTLLTAAGTPYRTSPVASYVSGVGANGGRVSGHAMAVAGSGGGASSGGAVASAGSGHSSGMRGAMSSGHSGGGHK